MDSTKQEPEEISEIITLMDLEDYVKEEPEDLNVLELQLLEEDEQKNANPDNSAFVCKYCGARFKQNSVLRMHQNYKKVGVKYTCRLGDCVRTFFCKQQKNDHVELYHPPNEPQIWQCSVCSFIAKSSNGLKSHSLIHTAKHRCDQCLRSFKTRILLNSHRKTHKIKSTCNKCGLEFETRKSFREHQSQMGNLKCLLCDEEFECEHARSQHLYKDHEKGFGCLKCPYIAKDRSGLEDHCEDKHRVQLAAVQHKSKSKPKSKSKSKSITESKSKSKSKSESKSKSNALLEKFETIDVGMKFKCDRCGLSFKEKQKLCAHILVHSMKLICSCNECGARFTSLEYLELHHKFFSGKFKCTRQNCDKVFKCKRAMLTHLKDHVWKCSHCLEIFKTQKELLVHEKEKNHKDYVWKCSHCLEIFKTKKKLLVHKKEKHHKYTRKYVICGKCGKTFKDALSLKEHRQRMSKYTCVICDQEFQCKFGLGQHEQQNHENEVKCRKCPYVGMDLRSLRLHCYNRHIVQPVTLEPSLKMSDTHNKYACSKCGLEFGTRKDFRRHQSQIGNFKCLLCDEEFECEHARSQHLYKDHEKGFRCLKCPYIAKDRSGLEDHYEDKHRVQLAAVQHNALLEKFETIDVGMKFKCDRCGLSFEEKQKLCAHMLDHLTKFIYSCNECGARFTSLEYLKLHQKSFSGKFKCYRKKCDKVFRCQRAMKTHLKEDHVWKCSHCLEIFKTQIQLQVHKKEKNHKYKLTHRKEDHVWKCSHCLEIFKTKKKLLVHEKEKHHKYNSVACGKCGKTFKNAKFLKQHRQRMSKYTCVICDQQFQCSFAFHRHNRQEHEEDFKCRKCPFVGTNLKLLRTHCISRHKNQSVTLEPSVKMSDTHNKYACSKCGLEFGTRKDFRGHQSQIGNFKCLLCDEEFECEYAKSQHLERDHDIAISQISTLQHKEQYELDVETKFECDHCGLSFDKRQKLLNHMNNHMKFDFSCDDCGARFSRLENLTSHRKKYSGNFKCSRKNCNKVFKCKQALKIHAREEHEQKWKCSECPEIFKTLKKFKLHRTIYHRNLRDIAEPLCISKDPKSTKNQRSNQQEMCSDVSQRLDTNISTVVQHDQEDSSVTETLDMNVYVKEEPEVSYVLKFPSEDEY